jgi:hypothetical protein
MTRVRETAEIVVTRQVPDYKPKPRPPRPKPTPTVPEPEVSAKDLRRMPPALRKVVLEACKGDLHRLSFDEDGAVVVR